MLASDYKQRLMSNDWFSSLPIDVIDKLVSLCKLKTIDTGQYLIARNGPADGMYCLVEGKLRISNVNQQGKEMVLTWISPGTWFGEISLFDGLPRTHDSIAETQSTLLLLPAKSFHELLAEHPELYPHFMKQLCRRLRSVFSVLDEANGLSLKQQLMKRLLMLSDAWRFSDSQITSPQAIDIEVSQEALARLLNTSRQTINKLLQELQAEALISLGYRSITLLQPQALDQACKA
ncbi:Crp/Fnr family transcriptional regulator [Glaciecola sp. MH2013]|nr:Crp/Fnr family transcriptional regulator [Glaciecola sp. MH2013]